MFTNPSPLVTSQYQQPRQTQPNISPNEVELMMKQKFQQPPFNQYGQVQQVPQVDPYSELQNELMNCSPTVRNKIVSDAEYRQCDLNCDMLLKQAIEEAIIPQLLNTSRGRMEFEKFSATVKQLKERYTREEISANEQLQALLTDEVVLKRVKELSQMNEKPIEKQTIETAKTNSEYQVKTQKSQNGGVK